ncbi:MAG: signal recognition particle-docking protein FtsY [Candidatus Pacearchaeota archaeon]|nr:signal recognition particle-docking protein FtsY [Candidatus Pacearchaeota archaeon]
MFNFLKDKLKSWFKSSEEKAKTAEKEKKKPAKTIKLKQVKEKKQKKEKPKKQEKSQETLKKERKVTEQVVQDIKQEGLEITTPEQRTEELLYPKEEVKEQPKKGFFSRLKETFISSFKLDETYFEEIFSELELILLENNVAYEVVEKIKKDLKQELLGLEIKKSEVQDKIKQALRISIESLFEKPFNILEKIKEISKEKPAVIVFFGINGSGKTTTIAKLASLLQKNKISSVLAAGDTFRAASIEQLEEHASRLGVKLIKSQYNSDPASVAFDAINHAKSHKIQAVLIDTAGRMHTKASLLKEMEKIIRVSKPDLKIFVIESITGNDAIEQAKIFNEAIGIDGIILTKADVDEKAGTTLSVSYVTGKPILFLGTGQNYSDLEPFDKTRFLEKLGL